MTSCKYKTEGPNRQTGGRTDGGTAERMKETKFQTTYNSLLAMRKATSKFTPDEKRRTKNYSMSVEFS